MHTCMTLDHWLQVGGVLRRSNTLLLQLREQVTAAIAWKALDVPWRSRPSRKASRKMGETYQKWWKMLKIVGKMELRLVLIIPESKLIRISRYFTIFHQSKNDQQIGENQDLTWFNQLILEVGWSRDWRYLVDTWLSASGASRHIHFFHSFCRLVNKRRPWRLGWFL